MDRFTLMHTFVDDAEAEAISAAAQRSGRSKAVISKYLSALEARLGVKLIRRTTRRMSLTDEGQTYLERCRRILEDVAEAEESVGRMRTEAAGRLRINAPMSFGQLHLAAAVVDFMAEHPRICIDLTLNDRFVDPVEEGYDVTLRINRPEDSSLMARRLAPARIVTCGSPEYFRRHGQPETPHDLAQHNCFTYTVIGSRWPWRHQKGPQEITSSVQGSLRTNNGDILRAAALAGLGVTRLPTFIVGRDLQAGTLRTVLTEYAPPNPSIYAVYPPNRQLSTRVRLFIDFLADRFAPPPYWDLVE